MGRNRIDRGADYRVGFDLVLAQHVKRAATVYSWSAARTASGPGSIGKLRGSKTIRTCAIWLVGVVSFGSLAGLAAPGSLQAATYTMTASDASGSTSFNTAGHWNAGGAPSAGNSYYTSDFDLRTPTTGGIITFAGSYPRDR